MEAASFRRLTIVLIAAAVLISAAGVFVYRELSGPLDLRVFRPANALLRPYVVARDVAYREVGSWTGRADIYRPAGDGPFPVILFFHGGGWAYGSQRDVDAPALPFLRAGYAIVAVSYRLADVALAPGAVEDARCALAWVGAHAHDYRLDLSRIVTAGTSAGGHLALMAGLVSGGSEFDTRCESVPPRVQAIINVSGITDVGALLRRQLQTYPEGWPFVVDWLGQGSNRAAVAERVSPVTWVDTGDPPVFSVHGSADSLVPHEQAVALHRALDRAGVENELVTLAGREHGDFSVAELGDVARRMQAFVDPKLRSAIVPAT